MAKKTKLINREMVYYGGGPSTDAPEEKDQLGEITIDLAPQTTVAPTTLAPNESVPSLPYRSGKPRRVIIRAVISHDDQD